MDWRRHGFFIGRTNKQENPLSELDDQTSSSSQELVPDMRASRDSRTPNWWSIQRARVLRVAVLNRLISGEALKKAGLGDIWNQINPLPSLGLFRFISYLSSFFLTYLNFNFILLYTMLLTLLLHIITTLVLICSAYSGLFNIIILGN